MLASLARACVRHRWIVIGAWVALLVVVNGIASAVGPDYRTDFTLPDSESKDVQELLEASDPNRAGFTAQIVAKAEQGIDDPEVTAALEDLFAFADSQDGVTVTSPYDNPQQISEQGDIAYAQLDVADMGFEEVLDLGMEIEDYGDENTDVQGLTIEYGGDPFSEFELPESEIYGIIAAVIILILAFGSVLAMGLPIGTALFGLGIGTALVSLLSNFISMPDFTVQMVAMIGLGVGIDYALFIVTRYREGLRLGLSVEEAIVESIDTSGRAVLFAGITVIISLMGLFLMGLSFVQGIAVASSVGVLMMILGSLTLVPALLGWVGRRIDNTTRAALIAVGLGVAGALFGVITGQAGIFLFGMLAAIGLFVVSFFVKPLRKLIPHRAEPEKTQRVWYRWSRFIQHRPWPAAIGAASLLILLAIPLFSIRLGFGDYGNYPEDTTVRRAYDLLAEGFGEGTNGPLFITVEGEAANDEAALGAFVGAVQQTENVATAFPTPIGDGLALVIVNPESAPQDAETSTLVNTLRDDVIPASGLDAQVGGLHRRLDRLLRLPRRAHAPADRRRPAAQLHPPDGRVPQRARPAQGGGDEPAVDRCRLRHHRGHLPVGLGQGHLRARPQRSDRRLDPDVPVRHRLRPVDGLRGVPPQPDQGGVRPDEEQRDRRRRRPGRHGPGDHRRRADHVLRVRRLRPRRRPGAQAVRPRPRHRRADRRHDRPHGARAGHDGAARRPQLVDPEVARPDAAEHRDRGQAPHRPRPDLRAGGRGREGARARLMPQSPRFCPSGSARSGRSRRTGRGPVP